MRSKPNAWNLSLNASAVMIEIHIYIRCSTHCIEKYEYEKYERISSLKGLRPTTGLTTGFEPKTHAADLHRVHVALQYFGYGFGLL
jgi:hypothetical protein